jgi:hypothetical protein
MPASCPVPSCPVLSCHARGNGDRNGNELTRGYVGRANATSSDPNVRSEVKCSAVVIFWLRSRWTLEAHRRCRWPMSQAGRRMRV